MDMNGEYRIDAPRETVWESLNDPEVLRQCIPGCETVERHSESELTATAKIKIGPVKAKFTGVVTLSDLNPPESYTITGEGKGGAAGFAKGGAHVRLTPDGDDATVLHYDVHANVGGKLAQLGSRLIDSTAKKMSDEFFGRFAAAAHDRAAGTEPGTAEAAAAESEPVSPPATAQAPISAPSLPADDVMPKAQTSTEPAAAAEPVAGSVAESVAEPPPAPPTEPDPPEAASPLAPQGTEPAAAGLSPAIWITGVVVLALVLILIFAG